MKSQVISFHCVLRNKLGRVLSSTTNHEVLTGQGTPGPDGPVLPDLARGLVDLKKGERRKISIPAEKGYGLYDPDLVLEVSLKRLSSPREITVGDQVEARCRNGRLRMFRIVRVESGRATLDANHPFAGQDLVFDIEAIDVREATSEELRESLEMPSVRIVSLKKRKLVHVFGDQS